jgi:hypothetical protein
MEMAIVLLLILAGVVYFIVRPGSKVVDEVKPTTAPAPAPAPSVPRFESSELETMTKADLLDLALAKDVHVAKSWNKGRIVAALTAEN